MGRRPKLPRDYTPWWIPKRDPHRLGAERSFTFEYATPQDALNDLEQGIDKREGMPLYDPETKPATTMHESMVNLAAELDRELDLRGRLPIFIEPPALPESRQTRNVGAALEWMNRGHADRLRSALPNDCEAGFE